MLPIFLEVTTVSLEFLVYTRTYIYLLPFTDFTGKVNKTVAQRITVPSRAVGRSYE